MTHDLSPEVQARGEYLMERGNAWTRFRAKTSPVLGMALGVTDEGWVTTALLGVEGFTDWLDGHDAKKGSSMLGIETTIEGALEDPKADKILVNSVLLGLAVRYMRQGDIASGSIVATNYAVSKWRDKRMEHDRALAQVYGFNPKAIIINKAKTDLQLGGEGVLVSPLAKNRRNRAIGLAMLSIGTVLGVIGERVFRRRVSAHILALELQESDACPDTVTAHH